MPGAQPHQLGLGLYAEREIRTSPRSAVHRILDAETTVDCHHHQALDTLADGLTASAWFDDGVVEAVEMPGRRFCVRVRWHPEESRDGRLFAALVAATR